MCYKTQLCPVNAIIEAKDKTVVSPLKIDQVSSVFKQEGLS